MGRKIEPNAQNSERDPAENPSSARIEKIIEDTDPETIAPEPRSGLREVLRPSERESPVVTNDPEKAPRTETHRTDPEHRQS